MPGLRGRHLNHSAMFLLEQRKEQKRMQIGRKKKRTKARGQRRVYCCASKFFWL